MSLTSPVPDQFP